MKLEELKTMEQMQMFQVGTEWHFSLTLRLLMHYLSENLMRQLS